MAKKGQRAKSRSRQRKRPARDLAAKRDGVQGDLATPPAKLTFGAPSPERVAVKGKAKTSPKRSAVKALSAKKAVKGGLLPATTELPAAQSYKSAAGDASVLIGDKTIKL